MPLAHRRLTESAPIAGVSSRAGRPLFVPPGIHKVRTGPTTRAELDRLLADVEPPSEVSGVRNRQLIRPGLWLRLLSVLGFAPRRAG